MLVLHMMFVRKYGAAHVLSKYVCTYICIYTQQCVTLAHLVFVLVHFGETLAATKEFMETYMYVM